MRKIWLISGCLFASMAFGQETKKEPLGFGITVSFPWVNQYYFYDYQTAKDASKAGFVGLGAALFLGNEKRKFSINAGLTGDLPVPIGPMDFAKEGDRASISTNFIEGLYHHNLGGRFNIIGGANFTYYNYNYINYDTDTSYQQHDHTLGLTLGTEYRFTRVFSLAFFYRPALIMLNQPQYRHLFSLDARFDINFSRN